MPSGAMGRRVTAILAEEWWGVLNRSWNSERPLVFANIILTNNLGVHRAQEIRARITRRMDLWERGQHEVLVEDAKVEGAAREGKSAFIDEEEDNAVAQSFHKTVLSGKLCQAVRRATDREGGGCLLPWDKCTKTGRPFADVFREKPPGIRVPPVENTACAAFEEYEDIPEDYPSSSRRTTSRRSHRSSLAQHVCSELKWWSCAIGSFASDAHQRSYGS